MKALTFVILFICTIAFMVFCNNSYSISAVKADSIEDIKMYVMIHGHDKNGQEIRLLSTSKSQSEKTLLDSEHGKCTNFEAYRSRFVHGNSPFYISSSQSIDCP